LFNVRGNSSRRFREMKKLTITTAAALGALAAFCAWGAPGDIISSFPVKGYNEWPAGVYRDADFVYVVFSSSYLPLYHYLYKYTPSGSYVGSLYLQKFNFWPLQDADHSRWGAGYMTVGTDGEWLFTFDLSTGKCVEAKNLGFSEVWGYAYRPGGKFAFVSDDLWTTYKYNSSWSVVSSFPWGGGLAATDRFRGRPGDFVIRGGRPASVYTATGSLVGTFANNSPGGACHGIVCGPGYPGSWGTTFWRYDQISFFTEGWVYQIDLGNTTDIEPASLGCIRALFR
jgi:hypothetical protein